MSPRARNRRSTSQYVALLRGINVGGKNKLPMAKLREIFEAAGCEDVRTYIQSGNVVFRADPNVARGVGNVVTTAIRKGFGYEIPVMCRSTARLREVLRSNPFLDEGRDLSALHVAFLARRPRAAKVVRLDPHRSPGDRFAVRGTELFLDCPNGIGRSKLTNAYFDAVLETVSTLRNWKTVVRLGAMLEE